MLIEDENQLVEMLMQFERIALAEQLCDLNDGVSSPRTRDTGRGWQTYLPVLRLKRRTFGLGPPHGDDACPRAGPAASATGQCEECAEPREEGVSRPIHCLRAAHSVRLPTTLPFFFVAPLGPGRVCLRALAEECAGQP